MNEEIPGSLEKDGSLREPEILLFLNELTFLFTSYNNPKWYQLRKNQIENKKIWKPRKAQSIRQGILKVSPDDS